MPILRPRLREMFTALLNVAKRLACIAARSRRTRASATWHDHSPERTLDVFLRDNFDAVITNAAGCGSTLKEYEHLFPADAQEHAKAHEFRKKMRDATEFLVELGPTADLATLPVRVTYQDSCHLLHGQKVREAQRKLLRSIPGLEVVEMPMADYCCGSAGSYNVTETQTSLALATEKMKHARATNAPIIVTTNPGCLLQMRGGLRFMEPGRKLCMSWNCSIVR